MKLNILSKILVSCVFVVSSAFCTEVFMDNNKINIHSPAISYCMNNNIEKLCRDNSLLKLINFDYSNKYNTHISFPEYVEITNFESLYEELPMWYFFISLCKSFIIMHELHCALYNEISYESLQDKCKKLLNGNIKELKKKKCDIKVAQKLSVLTAINTSWKDALSAIKEINKSGSLFHNYTLTEALFILHLKPSRFCLYYI